MRCTECARRFDCLTRDDWTVSCLDFECEEPLYEAYTFDERTGSERIHLFYTQEAADAFIRRQPPHRMAH